MNTTLHSFVDIFETEFHDGQETVSLKKIIIPIIQRDYAQGRLDPDINRIRDRRSSLALVFPAPTIISEAYYIDSD